MKLKILGSSSAGNGYIFENNTSALVIEAGVSLKALKVAIDFKIRKIEACIVSHVHGDHARHVEDYLNAGITVYGPKELKEKYAMARQIFEKRMVNLNSFKFQAHSVVHDVETYCFLIAHEDLGLTCFVTDAHFLPYKFAGLTQMIIECNYCSDLLDQSVLNGRIPPFVRNRILTSHMSLDTVKEIMRVNDLKKVNNIVLTHLSDGNSDAKRFQKEIQELTGKKVTIAAKGVEIDFNKEF